MNFNFKQDPEKVMKKDDESEDKHENPVLNEDWDAFRGIGTIIEGVLQGLAVFFRGDT